MIALSLFKRSALFQEKFVGKAKDKGWFFGYIAQMPNAAVIIPARLGSTRLKHKPLALLGGKPMVVRVAELAQEAEGVSRIIVATDAEEIAVATKKAGFEVVMTSPDCPSGTDRVAEVAAKIKEQIIVNLQGDEPMMAVDCISRSIRLIEQGNAPMSSCFSSFRDREQFNDPTHVKVILNDQMEAIYFSRALIPYRQLSVHDADFFGDPCIGRHLGLYAYDRDFLLRFTKLKPVFLEKIESLEQLRALYHGYKIAMSRVESDAFGINTPEELEKAQALFIG